MTECPHCARVLEVGVGHLCPACGKDMLLPPSSSAPQPVGELAHDLELTPPPLHPSNGAPTPAAPGPPSGADREAKAKKRLKSRAGPARPVPATDIAATGWGTAQPHAPRADAPPPLPDAPPPLPSAPARPRPAHLLLAELEAKKAETTPSEDLSRDMPAAEIALADVQKPEVPRAKRGPSDRAIRFAALFVIAVGIVAVVWTTTSEPGPAVKVDAALENEARRRRQAMTSLERGHALALKGPEQADAAIAAYERALELVPDLASAEKGLAIAHAAKDRDDVAVAHYRRYLELAPDADDADEVQKIIRDWERAQRR